MAKNIELEIQRIEIRKTLLGNKTTDNAAVVRKLERRLRTLKKKSAN